MSYDNGFATSCDVAIANTYATTGTLTRASLSVLTPTQIKALFSPSANKWAELDALQSETKTTGAR